MKSEKKSYTMPKLTTHGDLEVLTQGTKSGNSLDKAFPVGFPFDQVTRS